MPAVIRIVLMLAFLPAVVLAHTDVETGQDYSGFLRNDGRGSCCDWVDCRPASAPFATPDGQKIADRVGNVFAFDVRKLVARPSDDGNWHICANSRQLFCIIAPAESSRQPGHMVSRKRV